MQNQIILQSKLRIQEIDGLRGIAILSVVILHWIIQPFTLWHYEVGLIRFLNIFAYGVDLFFVISGFLIGGILVKAAKKPSGIATFYIRRIMRIWPLYYLLLAVSFLLWGRQYVIGEIPLWTFYTFIFNYWESIGLEIHKALGPLWSLAIEEQFYVLGPLLFYFLDRRQLMYLVLFSLVVSPFLRLALILNASLDIWRFTPARLDGICMGLFLSLFLASPSNVSYLMTKLRLLKGATILSLSAAIILKAILPKLFWNSFGYSIMALSFGLLLTSVMLQSLSNKQNRILTSTALRYMGLRCYNIYLFHIFFMILANNIVRNFFVGLILQVILTLGFAHISWKYIESHYIRLGHRFSY